MIKNNYIKQIRQAAVAETDQYGAPSIVHLDLAENKGLEIARQLGARTDLVQLGVYCMDIKLGQAFRENRLDQHVKMSLAYTKKLLHPSTELTSQEKSVIYNSVEAHHGQVKHNSLESEIVTNADCYRFIHPIGVTWWNAALGTRFQELSPIIDGLSNKLEEKWALVSLPLAKKELEPYYQQYRELFSVVQKGIQA